MTISVRRSNAVLAAFSGPCLPLAAFGVALPVTLPDYYATFVGLPVGAVGAVFMAVRLIDIVFDPILGAAMDRTRTGLGRYRPWMLISVPVLMLAAWTVFVGVEPGAGPEYLFLWLLVLYLGFSIGTLAQLGWASVLSPEYDQRSRVYAWWQAFNIVGVLVTLVTPAIVAGLKLGSYVDGVHVMGWGIVALLPLTFGLAVWGVPEPVNAGATPHGGLKAYVELFKRKAVRKLLFADVLLGVAPGITGALLFFFFGMIKGYDRTEASLFMLAYFVAGLLGAPIWVKLAAKFGKDRALAMASLIFAALYLVAALLPGRNFAVTIVGMFVAGLPYAAGLFLLRAMMADVGDEVRLETGVDRTGLLFAILSGTTKIGHVLALAPFLILQAVGFQAVPGPAGNSQLALITLQGLFVAAPTLLIALAAFVLRGYPLTPERHDRIRAALEAREAAV